MNSPVFFQNLCQWDATFPIIDQHDLTAAVDMGDGDKSQLVRLFGIQRINKYKIGRWFIRHPHTDTVHIFIFRQLRNAVNTAVKLLGDNAPCQFRDLFLLPCL